MELFRTVARALCFVGALSLDTLAASFSYGVRGIRIPPLSAAVMRLIGFLMLAASLGVSDLLRAKIPAGWAKGIGFVLLFGMGVWKLWECVQGKLRARAAEDHRFLSVVQDCTKADADESKTLSVKEAVLLTTALSLDTLAAGVGAGLCEGEPLLILVFSFFTEAAALHLGCFLGCRLSEKKTADFSWLSGVVLILLALARL